jgi:hypothetical protein
MCKSFKLAGEYIREGPGLRYWEQVCIIIPGRNYAGYSIGFVPPGYAARQVTQGPLVPGPWAFISANASVIDNFGGTKREIVQAAVEGRLVIAQLGDYLSIDGHTFRIQPYRYDRVNVELILETPQ